MAAADACYLCDLPDELTLTVFSYLDIPSLCGVAATCRQLNRIAADDSIWRAAFHAYFGEPTWVDENYAITVLLKSGPYSHMFSGYRIVASSTKGVDGYKLNDSDATPTITPELRKVLFRCLSDPFAYTAAGCCTTLVSELTEAPEPTVEESKGVRGKVKFTFDLSAAHAAAQMTASTAAAAVAAVASGSLVGGEGGESEVVSEVVSEIVSGGSGGGGASVSTGQGSATAASQTATTAQPSAGEGESASQSSFFSPATTATPAAAGPPSFSFTPFSVSSEGTPSDSKLTTSAVSSANKSTDEPAVGSPTPAVGGGGKPSFTFGAFSPQKPTPTGGGGGESEVASETTAGSSSAAQGSAPVFSFGSGFTPATTAPTEPTTQPTPTTTPTTTTTDAAAATTAPALPHRFAVSEEETPSTQPRPTSTSSGGFFGTQPASTPTLPAFNFNTGTATTPPTTAATTATTPTANDSSQAGGGASAGGFFASAPQFTATTQSSSGGVGGGVAVSGVGGEVGSWGSNPNAGVPSAVRTKDSFQSETTSTGFFGGGGGVSGASGGSGGGASGGGGGYDFSISYAGPNDSDDEDFYGYDFSISYADPNDRDDEDFDSDEDARAELLADEQSYENFTKLLERLHNDEERYANNGYYDANDDLQFGGTVAQPANFSIGLGNMGWTGVVGVAPPTLESDDLYATDKKYILAEALKRGDLGVAIGDPAMILGLADRVRTGERCRADVALACLSKYFRERKMFGHMAMAQVAASCFEGVTRKYSNFPLGTPKVASPFPFVDLDLPVSPVSARQGVRGPYNLELFLRNQSLPIRRGCWKQAFIDWSNMSAQAICEFREVCCADREYATRLAPLLKKVSLPEPTLSDVWLARKLSGVGEE